MRILLLALPILLLSGCYSSPEEELDTTRAASGRDSSTYISIKVDTTWNDTINYTF